MARELAHGAPVLIAEQPTRGVDVGAIEFIHGQLLAERDKRPRHPARLGRARRDPDAADRILVMFEGRIVADLPREKPTSRRSACSWPG